jgi:hypothetical protein
VFICLLCATPALAQSTKTSLSGTVVDTDTGVIPGANIVVKNNATGVTNASVTNTRGVFSIPSLDPGTYTVTATLSGFKPVIMKDVVLAVGSPADIKITLTVGSVTEAVEVVSRTGLVQTQSTSVSATINATQIENLPLTSRNVLFGFVTMLPGVDTPGAPRDSKLFGLPEESINITINGINTNNNFQRDTDGFYSMVFPQLDAIEQVTVTGAAAGAESAAGGSVAIKFVTKSGTNRYALTPYYYLRHPAFNTNDYFSKLRGLPKTQIKLNQFGGSLGGPLKVPGLFDGSGKAFFFFNYEEFRQPTSTPLRTRQMLNERAQQGFLRYNVTSGGVTTVTEVNVLAVAAANNQVSTVNPTIGALLAQIRSLTDASVTKGFGVISDQGNVNLQQFDYKDPGNYVSHFPTTRLDFNLSPAHRLSGSYIWQEINRFPDIQNSSEATFPGLPNFGNYTSLRTVGSVELRSTLSTNFVNELTGGWQWSPGTFNSGVTAAMFDNQGGFSLGFPLGATSASRTTNPNTRHQTNIDLRDTVNWLKGNHSFSLGGGFTRVVQWNDSYTVAPSIGFGVQSVLDPADAMFTTANFPGASTDNLNNARALYAFLTGRVTAVNANARLNENTDRYEYNAPDIIRVYQDEYSAFLQDSWRIRPTLTINAGVAWVVQMPIKAGNNVYSTTDYAGFCGPYGIDANGRCKLFQVGGEQTGVTPAFVQYNADTKGYRTDLNNAAPNIGAAWRPNIQRGFLRRLFGDPEQATIRAGFSIGFNKTSMGAYTGLYGNNPGRSISANRNNTGSNFLLVGPGETWPVLFSDPSRLGPPAGIPERPAYPLLATTGSSLSIFDPDIQVPYTRSFSVGFQRALGRDMAVEVRYLGTRGEKLWTNENWNETNIIENGFLEEFKVAQANLRASVNQGLCAIPSTCTFAYRGPGTGTEPLPIYLAYLTGTPFSLSGDPARYTASLFTNTTFLGRFNQFQPDVFGSANTDLQTPARITNALTAGLPSNFFRMNPAIGTNSDNLTTSGGRSRYDSFVIDWRRRLSKGLHLNASFTKSWQWGEARDSLRFPRFFVRSTNNVPNAFKTTVAWELPIGRARRFGTNANKWLDGAIGGWSFNLTGRVQSGTQLTTTGAKLVGMTEEDLQREFRIRIVKDEVTGVTTVFNLPDDIILNTRRAFSTSATSATGYSTLGPPEGRYIAPAGSPECFQLYAGDCADRNIFVSGPIFSRFDISVKKKFPLRGRALVEFEVDVLNPFNAINFNPTFNPGSGSGIMQVSSAYQDVSGTYDPGGRLIQLVWRVRY